MSLSDEILELNKRAENIRISKIRIEERIRSAKSQMLELENEIRSKGFDPANLKTQLEDLINEVRKKKEQFEKDVIEAEATLAKLKD